jgi:hypothetical protein
MEVEDNEERVASHSLANALARFIRFDIISDNGNMDVALVGLAVHTPESLEWPVALVSGRESRNPKDKLPFLLVDNNPETVCTVAPMWSGSWLTCAKKGHCMRPPSIAPVLFLRE